MMINLLLKLISSFAIIISQHEVTQVMSNHVDAVSCAMRPDCLTAINEEIVSTIIGNIHNDTDPCENFWDYACGDWTAAPYYDHVDTFGAIANYYNDQLKNYLEHSKVHANIEKLQQKLRNYYDACRQAGSYYLDMEKYFIAWPAMPNINWPNFKKQFERNQWKVNDDFNWLNAIAELRRYGVNGILLDESIGFATKDSTKYVIELKMPEEEDEFQNKYDFINYFIEFGWIEEQASTEEQINFAGEIFELETQLRELRLKHRRKPIKDDGEQALTLHELKERVGDIDWQAYFNIILGQIAPQSLPIELENIAYMSEMAALLEQTDDNVICYYMLMRLCKFLLEASPRITNRNCIEHMQVTMSLGMDFIYDHELYKTRHDDERYIGEIFENLKIQFSKYFHKNKLQLNDIELNYLQEKLLKMQWRLGNLPHKSNDYFNNYYNDANITNQNFFSNHWELLRHRTQKQHELLLMQAVFVSEDYFVNDDIVQARNAPYFVHQRNLLIIPFNFVQMPFFHHKLHVIFQQSLMGWILAHEINHGFELDGIILDAEGNVSPVGVAIKLKPEFRTAVKCIRQTPPTASLIERMADINGFQLAYDAFVANNPSYLSNLSFSTGQFTTKQLYFLNFAQFFCGKLPQAIDHDRDDVRVIVILANMPEFAEAFNCVDAVGTHRMQKCQMWR